MDSRAFYDHLAPFYHLIYQDWDASIARQAASLDSLIKEHWVEDKGEAGCVTHVMRTRYYAVGIDTLMSLLAQAGFVGVERIDGRFFQPVIIAKRSDVRGPA